jgi:small subunit ribosomal protein S26e
MPSKRRNGGRNKNNKGHAHTVQCANCKRIVGKDKAIKRFIIKNLVDASSARDIKEVSVYNEGKDENEFNIPKIYVKNEYCVSCAIHARIVRVRSTAEKRVRYVSKYRRDQRDELTKLYRIANVRQGPKSGRVVNKIEGEEEK